MAGEEQSLDVQWEMAAGKPCSRCYEPSLRLFDGLCLPCKEWKDAREEALQRVLAKRKKQKWNVLR